MYVGLLLSTCSVEVGFKTSELLETKLRADDLSLSLDDIMTKQRASDTNQV